MKALWQNDLCTDSAQHLLGFANMNLTRLKLSFWFWSSNWTCFLQYFYPRILTLNWSLVLCANYQGKIYWLGRICCLWLNVSALFMPWIWEIWLSISFRGNEGISVTVLRASLFRKEQEVILELFSGVFRRTRKTGYFFRFHYLSNSILGAKTEEDTWFWLIRLVCWSLSTAISLLKPEDCFS